MGGKDEANLSRWFTPWRWKKWSWVALLTINLVAYVLSYVPMNFILRATHAPIWMHDAVQVVYLPMEMGQEIPAIRWIIDVERSILTSVFGKPR